MSPRILFLTERFPPDTGGVAASSGRIARALAGSGAQLDVVAWTRSLQAGEVAADGGNPACYRMGRFREWDNTMPHTVNLLDWLRGTHRYDWIWGHYLTFAGFLAVWYGRLQRIPSIVSIRGNDLDRDVFPPGDLARLEWTLRNADRVTAVTHDLARKAEVLSGRADVTYLPNAVDHELFSPVEVQRDQLRHALGIRAEEAVLGFSGELREKKGLQHLLRALRDVQARRPACLLIIGGIRPSERPRLLQIFGPGSLADHRVVVTGFLTPESVNAHLQLCDVYLQPSLWDGMPNALLEAMAAGCGCIVSDAGGMPEIVRSGLDGVIVPRWQLHRLGAAVLEWLNADPATRQRIRRAARSRVEAEFSPERESRLLAHMIDLGSFKSGLLI